MSHERTSERGSIEAVFAHRFVLKRGDGTRVLADLGPHGLEAFTLREGTEVAIEGERKPSEIKVTRIAAEDGAPIEIRHGKGRDGQDDADPAGAVAGVRKAGLIPIGEPRRKPKHFEVLARRGGDFVEAHVEFDGAIRKEKPADREKWADELAAA